MVNIVLNSHGSWKSTVITRIFFSIDGREYDQLNRMGIHDVVMVITWGSTMLSWSSGDHDNIVVDPHRNRFLFLLNCSST